MIYLPDRFNERRQDLVHQIIEDHNFGTLITTIEGVASVSHLPFLLEKGNGNSGTLKGHMARANPQWRSFKSSSDGLVIFHGPHAYISPRWYAPQSDNVPTWNYAVVHVTGSLSIIASEPLAFKAVAELAHKHDPGWRIELTQEDRKAMMAEIVAFEMQIQSIVAKFKLSQNRNEADRRSIADNLAHSSHSHDRETAALMGLTEETL
jgi:transcriptional regulator